MIYLVKINIAIIVLFGFYKLIFSNDTFFAWRRATLFGIYLTAILIPGLDFSHWVSSNTDMTFMADAYAENVLPEVSVSPRASDGWNVLTWLAWTYGAVVALLMLRFVRQLLSIAKLKKRHSHSQTDQR